MKQKNVDMQEEIFLPVEQSGRERSIIEVLDDLLSVFSYIFILSALISIILIISKTIAIVNAF